MSNYDLGQKRSHRLVAFQSGKSAHAPQAAALNIYPSQLIQEAMEKIEPTDSGTSSQQDAMLTEVQAAAILNIAPSTMAAWRSTKRAGQPRYYKVGGAVRYQSADIQAFIAASVQQEPA